MGIFYLKDTQYLIKDTYTWDVMVIVVGNGHGRPSLNIRQGFLHFT